VVETVVAEKLLPPVFGKERQGKFLLSQYPKHGIGFFIYGVWWIDLFERM
jgi:hypothetical protein